MNQFRLNKIEVRSTEADGVTPKKYVVKGYATVPEYEYTYQFETDSDKRIITTFREYFTERAMESIKRKAKKAHVFVDTQHVLGNYANVENVIDELERKSGLNITAEREYILSKIKASDVPMFKIDDLQIDENGMFVEVIGNPYYREIDDEHRSYFDAVWGSLEEGFINGMSVNFKPTKVIRLENNTSQIEDADIYGISLVSGAANDMASITEVARRSIEQIKIRGETRCQMNNKLVRTSLLM